jgi:hypothetical protein
VWPTAVQFPGDAHEMDEMVGAKSPAPTPTGVPQTPAVSLTKNDDPSCGVVPVSKPAALQFPGVLHAI